MTATTNGEGPSNPASTLRTESPSSACRARKQKEKRRKTVSKQSTKYEGNSQANSDEPDSVDLTMPAPEGINNLEQRTERGLSRDDESDMGVHGTHIEVEPGTLTLANVGTFCKNVELMSQVVANHWRYDPDSIYEDNCKLVVLSSKHNPEVLQRVDNGPYGILLKPEDVSVADAMAMSGAAVSINNGVYASKFTSIRGLQIFLGLSIGYAVLNPAIKLAGEKSVYFLKRYFEVSL